MDEIQEVPIGTQYKAKKEERMGQKDNKNMAKKAKANLDILTRRALVRWCLSSETKKTWEYHRSTGGPIDKWLRIFG